MAKEVPKKTMILESSAHSEFYSEWAFSYSVFNVFNLEELARPFSK